MSPMNLASLALVAVASASPPSSPSPRQATDEPALAERVERAVDALSGPEAFSGVVLLARGDDVLLRKAWGLASRRWSVPNRPDTLFNMGSMNKMLTGVAVCQLIERGKLAFDTKIGDVLPDYPNERARQEVTVEQLLTHTSGIGSYWNEEFDRTWPTLDSVSDYLALFAAEPLLYAPGERFHYSNGGPVVLGRMIEVLSGMTYDEYIRAHVTGPLGMERTAAYALYDPVPNLAMGHTRLKADGSLSDTWMENTLAHVVRGGPAGGGYTSVDDLLRFARGVQAHRVLSPEMTTTYLTGRVAMGPGAKYACLIGEALENGYVERGHNGGAAGVYFKEKKKGSGIWTVYSTDYNAVEQEEVGPEEG